MAPALRWLERPEEPETKDQRKEKSVSSVAREAIHTREEVDPTFHSGHGLNCFRTGIHFTPAFSNLKFSYNWTIECGLLSRRFNATDCVAEVCTLRGDYFSIRGRRGNA
jgi:hypothetical protein